MKPNIVLILADDTGYGDPQCYNPDSLIPTPNIDRLASEGTRFTDAHSASAICTPTRYGLLTGRYYWRTPKKHSLVMPYEPPVIEPDQVTLPGLLREAGYATGCVGKWHLGLRYPTRDNGYTQDEADIDFSRPLDGGPLDCGFDYFFGTAGCSTSDPPYCFIENRNSVGIPTIPSTPDLHELPGFYPGLMVSDWVEEDVDKRLVERAIDFMESSSQPFFLYLPISAPHNPWLAPDFTKGKSQEGPRGDMNVLVDWCVGRIYDSLKDLGILDDTLLIFTSDNGPMRGENGHASAGSLRGYKNTAFEGGHRVPFIARWPGHVAVAESDDLICLTDMTATFSALTGVNVPGSAAEDSHNVLGSLLNAGTPAVGATADPRGGRPTLVSDTGGFASSVGDFAIRWQEWKLIILAGHDQDSFAKRKVPVTDAVDGRLLFNLANDQCEAHNIVEDYPKMAVWLEALLAQVKTKGSRFVELTEAP